MQPETLPTPPERIGLAGGVLWIVFSPMGVPQTNTCRFTHDEAMQACFGRRERDRYPRDWWQHNLDEGWTCREIAIAHPAGGDAAGAEVETLLTRLDDASLGMIELKGPEWDHANEDHMAALSEIRAAFATLAAQLAAERRRAEVAEAKVDRPVPQAALDLIDEAIEASFACGEHRVQGSSDDDEAWQVLNRKAQVTERACRRAFADTITALYEARAQLAAERRRAEVAAIPEGYALVPVETTEEMMEAFCDAHRGGFADVRQSGYRPGPGDVAKPCWQAMLAAASSPSSGEGEASDG